ncbi:hypothetical protein K501DRAFT_333362 [Backusella circina FSU 941]|nr:hypothetical protein K501DRAFT_333362 [Backusella circina FSU 941]
MLNPLAHEFTFEAKLSPHSSNNNKKNARKPPPPPPPPKKETTAVESEKKGTKDKGKQVVRKPQSKDTAKKPGKKLKEDDGSAGKNKGKEGAKKKRDTRRQSVPVAAIPPNEFEQESPFIAIEAAIDPVHRLDNIASDSRRQSLSHDVKKQYEHGYERYIDWIDRSLQIYGIVTVVGMDKAIVDVISMVTILQERKIGEHQDTTLKRIDLPDLYNASFNFKKPTLEWLKNGQKDGIYTIRDPVTHDILLKHVEDEDTQTLVKASDLQTDQGHHLDVSWYELSQDARYLLLKTNVISQWRHSTHFDAYIYDLNNKSLFPLINQQDKSKKPVLSYVSWSPTGHQLAYVLENDIFITDLITHKRITFDGTSTIFNGVPDWIYEEEVFGTDYTLWWSPDSTYIAYLRLNETAVRTYQLEMYTTTNDSYPEIIPIKYPKSGSPNPLVHLLVYSLSADSTTLVTNSSVDDRIITDVIWTTTSSDLIFKEVNRVQTTEVTRRVTFGTGQPKSRIIRTYIPNDGAWVDPTSMVPTEDGYLDVRDNDGYMHLALVNGEETQWLTHGSWEVVKGTVVLDALRQWVYFMSTEQSPLQQHLHKIDLSNQNQKTCLTCSKAGYYNAYFSPKRDYYVLYNEGPDIPTTVIKKAGDRLFQKPLEENKDIKELLSGYAIPKTRYVRFEKNGIMFNAMEILPPDFDPSKKYPVLFHVYGGPDSQMVSYKYDFSWSSYLASKLDYIVVKVDGRGSGRRGRHFRTVVHKRLGQLEATDQINAARHWASLGYVDSTRIAIWGWSYGGFLTTKVIEADSGVFSVGLAVAPVTDWRLYDTIYTERYMLTPEMNPHGYETSAINNMTGFHHAKYLLIHGTGDDNDVKLVHFQNSAVLVDKLVQANVHDYQVQFFPDSSHSIRYHSANQEVYYLLTEFLWKSNILWKI